MKHPKTLLGACALLVVALWLPTPPPATARSHSGIKAKLPLWDRVLYKRFERADRLAQRAAKLVTKGKHLAAAALLDQAIRIRPYAASLWFDLGTAYSFAGRYADCVKAMHKARKIDAEYKKNLSAFRLGLCLSLTKRIGEGIKEYLKVRPSRWVPEDVLHWNLADDYMALGRLAEAVQRYRDALRRNPGQRVLHFALAVALDRSGRFRSAQRQLRRANRLDPTGASLNSGDIIWLPSHDHHYYRALRAFSLGRRAEALGHWQRFLRADPKGPWSYVVGRRLLRLRTDPITKAELGSPDAGVDAELLAAALTGVQPALRRCLGAAPPTGIAAHLGVRIKIEATRRGVARLDTSGAVGRLPTELAGCLQTALGKVRWTQAIKGRAKATFSFALVGP
ncbi:MAG: tetratricopeptide repeat protein [bacterium]